MSLKTRIEDEDIIWERFWFGQCGGDPEQDDELENFPLTTKDKGVYLMIKPPLRFKLSEYRALAHEIEKDFKADPERDEHSRRWFEKTLEEYRAGDTGRM